MHKKCVKFQICTPGPLCSLITNLIRNVEELTFTLFFLTDEKERFDPSQFQESIIQGLNQTGTDLEAVAKFLDASGAKLDYRRYAETLFDILVAGGMLGKRLFSYPSKHCNQGF